jgi:hypothetical protein
MQCRPVTALLQAALCVHCITACYYSVTTLSGAPTSASRGPTYREPMGNPCEPVRTVEPGVHSACQLCGTPVPDSPVTWMVENTARGAVWTCPACARANLRAIESKLDQEYW